MPGTRSSGATGSTQSLVLSANSGQVLEEPVPGPGEVNDPLLIFLVKNGSKGDKLLFRFPIPVGKDDEEEKTKKTKKNPYAVNPIAEDMYQNKPLVSSSIENGTVKGFDDKVLSNLFSAKKALCGERLEVKINDVRFISHPTLLQQSPELEAFRKSAGSSSFTLFNIVIALRARASHWVVENYHELCRRLSIALRHEEFRCGYLTQEAKIMQEMDDQVTAAAADGAPPLKSTHELILDQSQLAKELRDVFVSMCETGLVQSRFNKWIDVSFCLPQKVHYLENCQLVIEPGDIFKCLQSIFPYHGLLLLNRSSIDENQLWNTSLLLTDHFNDGLIPHQPAINSILNDDVFSTGSDDTKKSDHDAPTMVPAAWRHQQFHLLQKQREKQQQLEQAHESQTKRRRKNKKDKLSVLSGVDEDAIEAEKVFGEPLPFGASPAVSRLLRVASPIKAIRELADDSELTVRAVFEFCCQLVYWGKALIIYPLCETNVYILTPGAPVHSLELQEEFSETFGGFSLVDAAAEFSLPTSMSERLNRLGLSLNQDEGIRIIIWMLQKRLLMQLHTYVYFLPPGRPRKPRASSVRRSSYAMSGRSRQSTPDGELMLFAGDELGEDFVEEEEEDEEEDEGKRQRTKEALENARNLLPDLRGWELRAILKCPASQEFEELKLFAMMFPYFNGLHHLEEIMYCANVERSVLIQLLEKFRGVLLTCQHEDARLGSFYQHSASPTVSGS